ncbi:M48 family metallopeptidase [Ktedonobacter robiniae]|nr:M48 family metallopeptidase [Ktedonobacter robiniae]
MKQGSQTSTHKRQPETWYDDEEMRWAIRQWATRIGVKEPRVRFQMLGAQWGTITSSGWLTLDPILLRIPKALGEYVIVHELVHQLAPNHGRVFKLFLYAYMPDWEEREKRLQGYAQK